MAHVSRVRVKFLTFLKVNNRYSHLLGLFSSAQNVGFVSLASFVFAPVAWIVFVPSQLYLCLRLSLLFAECRFGGETYELEQTWHPDLGPPFNVMYCVHCECVPVSLFSTQHFLLEWIPSLHNQKLVCELSKVLNLINFLIPRDKN